MASSNYNIFNSTLPPTATETVNRIDRDTPGATQGLPSYFNATVTNGGLLNGGIYDAWCIRTDLAISSGPLYPVNVYSSYGIVPSGVLQTGQSQNPLPYLSNLQEVNWIFNTITEQPLVQTKPDGSKVYSYSGVDYTLGDVQYAIWRLTTLTGADVLNPAVSIPNEGAAVGTFTPQSGGYDRTRAIGLASLAVANGSNFLSMAGQDIGVILSPGGTSPTNQPTIIEVKTAGVGDTIFFDRNNNGLPDPGEGLANVTVKLDANNDGTVDGTTTTDINGKYLFGPILPGTYKVMVDTSTLPLAGIGFLNTVDPDVIKDSMSVVTLAPGQVNLLQDFGYRALDYGDAPDPTYPTFLASNGARHVLSAGQTVATPVLKLGNLVDTELNGQPNFNATGDNLSNLNDEDGITFTTPLQPNSLASISVSVMGNGGLLQGWIDFNRDGDWSDPGEQIFSNLVVNNGVNNFNFFVPNTAVSGDTFARFRLSTQQNLGFTGEAPDGEVEDYQVTIGSPPGKIGDTIFFDRNSNNLPDPGEGIPGVKVNLDKDNNGTIDKMAITDGNGMYMFPDLPGGTYKVIVDTTTLPLGGVGFSNTVDPDGGNNSMSVVNLPAGGINLLQDFGYQAYDFGDAPDPTYPTLSASNGARHLLSNSPLTPVLKLGSLVDTELNGLQSANALGDNLNNQNDEDGVIFSPLVAGQTSLLTVSVMGNGGFLNAWVDFNRDGDWNDPGEQVFTNQAVINGVNNLSFAVPVGANPGDTFTRFRLSSQQNLGTTGAAIDGEVEDYKVTICACVTVGKIGDTIFFDRNSNNLPDPGEGISGVKVNLDKDNNGTIDQMAITDGNGMYMFPDLPEGTYKVIVDTTTLPLGGVGWSNTVDPDGGNNSMSVANLPAGGINLLQDFGYQAYDFGDAPDPTYPTLLPSGARHLLSIGQTPATPLLKLGQLIDTELNGLPNATATGDNINNLNDEDGVTFSPLVPGQNSPVTVSVMGNGGFLNAWVDFNADGDWNDPGEKVFTNQAVNNGANNLNIAVPAGAKPGDTFTRFRLSSQQNLGTTGAAIDGEVEDYKVTIQPSPAPGIEIVKDANQTTVAPNTPVTYTYSVKNTGGVPLANITVTDDNATPTFAADDFAPTPVLAANGKNIGDLNGDNLLDTNETWKYSATVIPPLKMTVTTSTGATPLDSGILSFQPLANGDVRVYYRQSNNFNDNTYGTGSDAGWTSQGKTHTFNNLVGSDKAGFLVKYSDGTPLVQFYQDYITASGTATTTPPYSGYQSLGYSGGDGQLVSGNGSVLKNFDSTLELNLNQSGVANNGVAYTAMTVNSPTNGVNNPLPTDPKWDVVDGYYFTIDKSAFTGGKSFGGVTIFDQHNSPAKTGGSNTYIPDIVGGASVNTATVTGIGNGTTVTDQDDALVNITGVNPPSSSNLCDLYGKPEALRFDYEPSNIVMTGGKNNNQDGKAKIVVQGPAEDDGTSYVIVTNEDKKQDVLAGKGKRYFQGDVVVGNEFTASVLNANTDKFESNTYIYFFDDNPFDSLGSNQLLQEIAYHTSCSQPMQLGDIIGNATLVGYDGVNGSFPSPF